MQAHSHEVCPNCHSTAAVAKASALYSDCIYANSPKDRLPANWESWSRFQLVPTEAKARKALAKKLAPPPKPSDYDEAGVGTGIGGISEAGGCEELIVGFFLVAISSAVILLVKGLFELGRKLLGKQDAKAIEIVKVKEAVQQADEPTSPRRSPWQLAMNYWDSLYYCANCDGVFVPVAQKDALAYQSGELKPPA